MKKTVVTTALAGALLTGCGGGGGGGAGGGGQEVQKNNTPDVSKVPSTYNLKENTGKKVFDILKDITDKDGDVLTITHGALPNYITYNNGKITIDTDLIEVSDGESNTDKVEIEVSDGEDTVKKSIDIVTQDESNDSIMSYELNMAENINLGEELNIELTLSDDDIDSFGTLANSLYVTLSSDGKADEVVELTLENGIYKGSISNLEVGEYTLTSDEITPIIGGEKAQKPFVITDNVEVLDLEPMPAPYNLEINNGVDITDNRNITFSVEFSNEGNTYNNVAAWIVLLDGEDIDSVSVDDSRWTTSKPSSVRLSSSNGIKTVSVAVKNDSGVISPVVSDTIEYKETVVILPSFSNISDITELDGAGRNFSQDFSGYVNNKNGGTFSATGLPDGMTIDSNTGVVSGFFDASSSNSGWDLGGSNIYNVQISYTSNGNTINSNSFRWEIVDEG